MKFTVIAILSFAEVLLFTVPVSAGKTGSKSYTCISASDGIFLITDSNKTNKFKLYGVIFPAKKTFKQFAKDSDIKAKDLTDFLPTINNELNN